MTELAAIIRHEAGHAAALHAMGVPVHSVDRIATGTREGYVASDGTDAVTAATHIISAWLAEGDLPEWPLNSGPMTSVDEQILARLAEDYSWDAHDYATLVSRARQLMATPTFKRVYERVSRALIHQPMLDAEALRCLLMPQQKSTTTLATATVRDAVLADVRRRERELEDEQAFGAVALVVSALGEDRVAEA